MHYKELHNVEFRKEECERVLLKYPDKIPIICETDHINSNILILDKIKYLVDYDLKIGQFMYIIRKRLKVSPETALYLLINNIIIPTNSDLIGNIYNKYKDKNDNILYIMICYENFFG